VPIERVSILLRHQSVRITEKHYAPWVRSRQEQLEADLANAWSRDPLVLLQSGVHQRYTERSDPTTRSSSIRKIGARGGSRTHMRKNPRRILSPQRLPFRHPGKAENKVLRSKRCAKLVLIASRSNAARCSLGFVSPRYGKSIASLFQPAISRMVRCRMPARFAPRANERRRS
jgi:hypothetical protein